MTVREFADYCKVSPATISRYFNGSAGLSEKYKEAISQGVKATGYVHISKPAIKTRGQNETILALISNWQHNFNIDLLALLEKECQAVGKRLLVMEIDVDNLKECIKAVKRLNPMGIIALHEDSRDVLLEGLHKLKIPMVLCCGMTRSHVASSVYIDNMTASYDGAIYLLELGHKNIAIISDQPDAISSGFQRITGCTKAVEDAGYRVAPENIIYGGSFFTDGYRSMVKILENSPYITAVFAFSDAMAAGAIAAITDHGKKVPYDISVLGFDNSSISTQVRPIITTIAQPIGLIAKLTVEEIFSNDKKRGIQLSHTLIERESCAPPKASSKDIIK